MVAIGTLVLLGGLAVPFERTIATFQAPRSYIESGEKFGVRIGDSLESADRTLVQSGLIAEQPGVGALFDNCALRPTQPGEVHAFYGDHSWRRGYVCIVAREGHVVAVGWNFYPLAP
jgi:hypothetical protein